MYDKATLALIPSGYKGGGEDNLYSVLPANGDGDFDFSRGSTATRVNKDGLIESVSDDNPRLDYTGNVDCPHLLLEPQRTNLITYSEDLTDSSWAKQSGGTGTAPIVTSNNTISPDGTQNADKVVFDKGTGTTTSDLSILSASFTSQSNTASFYVKADSSQRIVVRNSNSFVGYDIGTDWTRIEKTDTGGSIQIGLRDGYGVADVPNTATVYLWGVQVEAADYATSYIPTSGSTVTRSADVCNSAGTSAEFNDSEGVLFAELSALANDGTNRRIAIPNSGTTGLHRIELSSTDNRVFGVTYVSPSNQAAIGHTLTDVTTTFKIAYKYKANDFALWVNGVEVGTDPSGSVPTGLTKLNFDNGSGNDDFYGKVKQLIYFNEALSDSELQTLTS